MRSDVGQRHAPKEPRKLTLEDVATVRALYREGWSRRELAERYGVTWHAIDYHVNPRQRKPRLAPRPEDDRGLVLDWLNTLPGYRAEIKRRVSAERKRIVNLEIRQEAAERARVVLAKRRDVDKLGREVEGCG